MLDCESRGAIIDFSKMVSSEITFEGKTYPSLYRLFDSLYSKVDYCTFFRRVSTGWGIAKALRTERKPYWVNESEPVVYIDATFATLYDLAHFFSLGIHYNDIRNKLSQGCDLHEVIQFFKEEKKFNK